MSNRLYHHGILGQKWGVRRFQNEDGSLTPAGKRRYRSGDSEPVSDEEKQRAVKAAGLEKAYRKALSDNSKTKEVKDIIDASSKVVGTAKQISDESIKTGTRKEKLDLSDMTDKEMRDRINRELLERQYNNLFAKDVSTVTKGQKAVNTTLSVAGDLLTFGSSALGIALAIKQLKKT